MDPAGWGFRGDAGLRFRAVDQLYLSTLLKGWTSSAASWESGEFEYSSPELYVAASYGLPVPYLYGKFNLYWQGAELLHREARDMDFETDESRGKRVWENPLDWLSGGRGGIEYTFDFGLSLRAGLSSFTTLQSVTAGAGLVIAKFVKVDYAFESHPVLSPVHRVSVSISPYLFSHAPKPGTPEATPVRSKNLTEEADDESSYDEMEREPYEAPYATEAVPEQPVSEEVTPAPDSVQEGTLPETQEQRPAGNAVVETDDEVLE
jgi:hypothetical protein